MTDDKIYTSILANTIMRKIANYVQRTRLIAQGKAKV